MSASEINTALIKIKNQKEEPTVETTKDNYAIEITKVDNETGETITSPATFEIVPTTQKTYTTSNGVIRIENLVAGEEELFVIQEKQAPEGYELPEGSIALSIISEENNNNISVTGVNIEIGSNIATATLENGTVKVKIENTRKEEEPPIIETTKDNYAVEITKVDGQTGEIVTSPAIFEIIPTEQKTYTTSNGIIRIDNLVAGEEELFVIQEKQAPEGYELPQESIALKVISSENNHNISITGVDIQMGSNIATATLEGKVIKVRIQNTKKQEDHLYVKSKKDTTGTDIYDLMNSYTGEHYTIENPFIDTKVAKSGNNVTVQEFIDNLESNGILTVWDEKGNQISTSSRVKTKMILKANKGDEELTFVIVVKGDGDGDGRVRSKDLDALTKHLSEESIITDPYFLRALDLLKDSGDGRVRSNDLNELVKVLSV